MHCVTCITTRGGQINHSGHSGGSGGIPWYPMVSHGIPTSWNVEMGQRKDLTRQSWLWYFLVGRAWSSGGMLLVFFDSIPVYSSFSMFKWQCHCNLPQFASFPQESRIHKDVKLENLMLLANSGPPHLVLIDLGVAETLQPQGLSAKWGVWGLFPAWIEDDREIGWNW